MPRQAVGTDGMVWVVGVATVSELDCDVGDVGREKLLNIDPFRVGCVDVVLKNYVKRHFEMIYIVAHGEHEVGHHVLKGGRLPSTDLTDAIIIRRYPSGDRANILSRHVTTSGTSRTENQPFTRDPIIS